jgi:hypothetical protein
VRDDGLSLLKDPRLLLRVIDDAHRLGIAGEEELIISFYLTGVSRLLSRPLATVTTGASSAGKSFVLDTIARLFPDESKFCLTTTSSKAFYYLRPNSLKHRWVICGEQARTQTDESEDVKRTLREMLSAGRITRAVALADKGQIGTTVFVQEGPIAYSDSTTQTNMFAEDMNRVITLHPDESSDQTRAVLVRTAEAYSGQLPDPEEQQRMIDVHHAAQRLLRQNRVAIPFADLIAQQLDPSNIEVRRALPLFFGAVEACTLLHQLQRDLDDRGRLLATADDYAICCELFTGWLAESLSGEISESTAAFHRWLQSEFDEADEITVAACVARGRGRGQVEYQLRKLTDPGLLQLVSRGRSHQPSIYRLTTRDVTTLRLGLPSVEAVQGYGGEA